MPTIINAAFLVDDCSQLISIPNNTAVSRESPPDRSPNTIRLLTRQTLAIRNVSRAAGRKTIVAISAKIGATVTAASNSAGPFQTAAAAKTNESVLNSLPANTAHK